MTANNFGSAKKTRLPSERLDPIEEMAAFDALPDWARRAVDEAPFRYSASYLADLIKDHGDVEAKKIVDRSYDRHIRVAAEEDYGPAHPQAAKRES